MKGAREFTNHTSMTLGPSIYSPKLPDLFKEFIYSVMAFDSPIIISDNGDIVVSFIIFVKKIKDYRHKIIYIKKISLYKISRL
jgi:hypothetical protein